MSAASQHKSQQYLEEMGVQLLLKTRVQDYDGKVMQLSNGQPLKTRTLIWTAGVTGNIVPGVPRQVVVKGNRIKVDVYNRVEGYENVFAIGDIAYMETKEFPQGHPQLANVAINHAKTLADNLKSLARNRPLSEFKYKNPGTMATVGKYKAVVDLPSISFQGRLAWLTWMMLHLMLILSVRNKLMIFINWAISYFTNDTTLRLILLPTRKQAEMAEAHNDQ
jgi:NADH dehydrogenase